MALCKKKVTKNQDRDCDTSGGVENVYYVFNREDIAAYIRDEDNAQIITDITMSQLTAGPPATYTKGFRFEGFNSSTKPKTALVVKPYSTKYDQTIDAVIFSRGSATKSELEAFAQSEVMIVVENKQKTADVAFEMYGVDVGLRLKALNDDPTNADNEGAYVIQWGSPEEYKEPHLPSTFFDTDYATTKANLLALISNV